MWSNFTYKNYLFRYKISQIVDVIDNFLLFVFVFIIGFFKAQSFEVYNLKSLDSFPNLIGQIKSYDVYFFGEEHGLKKTDLAQIKMIGVIGYDKTRILLEGPYERNFGIYKTFVQHDSTDYTVESFYPNKARLFRFIYKSKIPLKAIGIVSLADFKYFIPEIIELYSGKDYSKIIETDLELLQSAPLNYKPNVHDSIDLYLSFINQFLNHRSQHIELLGKRYNMVEECLEGLKASVYSYKENDKFMPYHSNARENFMFNMVKKEIEEYPQNKIISINGLDHTSLDSSIIDLNFVYKTWRPLCHQVRMAFPNKSVCSIYFLKRKRIGFFLRLRNKEYRYLFRKTNRREMYIVPIKDNSNWFKKLQTKVNYVVVY